MSDKPFSPSCERNREPILAVLREHFAGRRHVLEIGSGTGQHAVFFAEAMPWLTWQCSDRAEYLPGIRAWLDDAALPNAPAPVELDVASAPWPVRPVPRVSREDAVPEAGEGCGAGTPGSGHGESVPFDAAFSANTLHIMGWDEVQALFAALPGVLAADATVAIYGPFNRAGRHTSPGNAAFDAKLRAEDPRMGLRDAEAVDALARAAGLRLAADLAMPANNACLVWRTAEVR